MARSLGLRRALVDPPYRERALWTALGGFSAILFVVAGYVDSVFGNVPITWLGVIAEGAIWGAAFIFLLEWIVSNINVSLAADYFNRGALRWKRGGSYAVLAVFLAGYIADAAPSWWLPGWFLADGLSNTLAAAAFFGAIVYSASVLALTYSRILDRKMKTYTKWVALSLVSLFLFIAFRNIGPGWLANLSFAPEVLWAIFMYGTVTSLAIRTNTLTPA
jgi:hypothetical protein